MSGNSDEAGSTATSTGAATSEDAERSLLQQCVDKWNDVDHVGRQVVANGLAQGDVEVSVNISADYGDRRLITVAYPVTNVSLQLLETQRPTQPFALQSSLSDPAPVAALPESVKNWNANASQDGSLSLR